MRLRNAARSLTKSESPALNRRGKSISAETGARPGAPDRPAEAAVSPRAPHAAFPVGAAADQPGFDVPCSRTRPKSASVAEPAAAGLTLLQPLGTLVRSNLLDPKGNLINCHGWQRELSIITHQPRHNCLVRRLLQGLGNDDSIEENQSSTPRWDDGFRE